MFWRLLRYVFLKDWFFYNAYMIENWYAFEYTFRTAYKYQDTFKSLEQKAKENKVWFWSPDNCDWKLEIKEDPIDEVNKEEIKIEAVKEGKSSNGYSFYTSSHHSARLYYCETDSQWKTLSERNLRKFNSAEELLKTFPDRELSEACR